MSLIVSWGHASVCPCKHIQTLAPGPSSLRVYGAGAWMPMTYYEMLYSVPMLWVCVTGSGTQHDGARRGLDKGAGPPSRAAAADPEPPSSGKYCSPKEEAIEEGLPPRRLPYGGGAWWISCLMGVVVTVERRHDARNTALSRTHFTPYTLATSWPQIRSCSMISRWPVPIGD